MISTSAPHPLQVHLGTAQALKAVEQLRRLVTLDAALPEIEERGEEIDSLQKIWEGCVELSSLKESEAIYGELGQYQEIYELPLETAKTAETFQKCARKFWRDAGSVQISPLKKSHRGQNGPTLLISYCRPSPKLKAPKLLNYVIKWSDHRELCTTRVYDAFSQHLTSEGKEAIFGVPQVAAIDLKSGTHEMTDTCRNIIPAPEMGQLRESLEAIKGSVSCHESEQTQVMLMERIPGANIFDFAKTKYPTLSPNQKETFFFQLGQLAMLDVLMGNLDRFIPVIQNDTSGAFELKYSYEANLGNAMVVYSGEESVPKLYAIDSGVEKYLIDDDELQIKYNNFIKNLIDDSEMGTHLTKALLSSIQKSTELLIEEEEENPKAVKKQLESFCNDLNNNPAISSAVHSGITEMYIQCNEWLLPYWSGTSSKSLRSYLSSTYPDLLEAVSGRFNILAQKRDSL